MSHGTSHGTYDACHALYFSMGWLKRCPIQPTGYPMGSHGAPHGLSHMGSVSTRGTYNGRFYRIYLSIPWNPHGKSLAPMCPMGTSSDTPWMFHGHHGIYTMVSTGYTIDKSQLASRVRLVDVNPELTMKQGRRREKTNNYGCEGKGTPCPITPGPCNGIQNYFAMQNPSGETEDPSQSP